MMNARSNSSEPRRREQTAGAYGFTSAELRGIVIVGMVAVTVMATAWSHRQGPETAPAWVMQYVETEIARVGDGSARGDPSREERGVVDDERPARIGINRAGRDDLMRLPGIGPALADRIIESRRANGAFATLADLQRVRGIGPKRAAALAARIHFDLPDPLHREESDSL